MQEKTIEDLRKLAHQKFGRDLTVAEAQSISTRLPALAQAADLMLAWQSRLGEIAPSTVYSVPNEVRDDR